MENIHETVGRRISVARKQLNINQNEFASLLGKSLRTVQKYESGEIDMPLSVLQKISEVLGVSLNYLVNDQTSNIPMDNLGDVLSCFFEMDKKKEIHFDIKIIKNEKCTFNTKCCLEFPWRDTEAIYNERICKSLHTLKRNRESIEAYSLDHDTFRGWKESAVNHFRDFPLTNKKFAQESLFSKKHLRLHRIKKKDESTDH